MLHNSSALRLVRSDFFSNRSGSTARTLDGEIWRRPREGLSNIPITGFGRFPNESNCKQHSLAGVCPQCTLPHGDDFLVLGDESVECPVADCSQVCPSRRPRSGKAEVGTAFMRMPEAAVHKNYCRHLGRTRSGRPGNDSNTSQGRCTWSVNSPVALTQDEAAGNGARNCPEVRPCNAWARSVPPTGCPAERSVLAQEPVRRRTRELGADAALRELRARTTRLSGELRPTRLTQPRA